MSKLKFSGVTLMLAALIATVPAWADQHGSCVDSGMKKIRRLGVSPISTAPIVSRDAMVSYLESIRPDVDRIMARKGMSDRTDDLYAALRSSEVTEVSLERGDVVEWMIFRYEGRVAVGRGPYCVDTPTSYPAYEVRLVDEEDMGASVKRTTTTFLIPQICANLALGGTTTEMVDKPKPPPPPPPAPKPVPPPPPPPPPPVVAPEPPVEPEPEPFARHWTVRGFPLRMSTDENQFTSPNNTGTNSLQIIDRTDQSITSGSGAGFNVEYRLSERMGIEGGLLSAQFDSMLVFDSDTEWLMDHDDVSNLTVTVGPNFHFTPGKRADFYLGPFIGFAQLGDASYNLGGSKGTVTQNFGDEFVVGGQLGVDVPFGGSGWAVHAGVLYMTLGADAAGASFDLDPVTATVGLARSF